MSKIYNFFTGANKGLFALALTVFCGTAFSQTTYTLSYTGSVQTMNLQAGSYLVEMWGADGGGTTGNNTNAAVAKLGGKGGYAKGTLIISGATTASIYVGGKGSTEGLSVPGGFNGGGSSSGGTSGVCGSGGGASDIRVGGNALTDRKIVAGGGGAAGYQECNGSANVISGGNGGGLTGGTPVPGSYSTRIGQGGTQTAGGAGGTDATYLAGTAGSFGQGGNGGLTTTSSGNAAGGGGGWYGGGSGSNGFYCSGGGGGGSSYIGGVTSATTIMYGQTGFVTNPDVNGNGRVLITELCSIKLTASSSGTANPATLCSGNSLTITTDAISNYSWSTGATTNSIVVAPTTNTVYSLTAMSPANCITTANMTVIVSSGVPALTLAATPSSVCIGDSVMLNATGAITYTWSNGVSNNQLFPPPQTSTYVVTGKNGCGTSTAAIAVIAIPLPVTITSSTNTTCSGSPVTLTVSGGSSYTWSTNQTASVIVVAPTSQTTYTVAAKKGNCQNTNSITISTNPLPNIQLAGTSTNVCAGSSVTLTASGGSNSYTWNPSNFTGTVVTDTPTSSINYQVTGSNGFGCKSSGSHLVLVSPLPTITVSSPQPVICPGASITLVATGGHTYQWNTGAQTKTLLVSPSTTTSYTVTGTFTNTTCKSETYFTVNVEQPTLSLSPSQTVCPGTVVTMSASGSAHNWSNGGTSVYNSVTVITPTMYTVSSKVLTANNLLCQASGTVNLGMHPQPTVAVVASRTLICQREKTTLTASGADSYVWQNTSQPGSTQTFSSIVRTTYTIGVIGTDLNGCADTAQVLVRVSECAGLTENQQSLISVYPNPSAGIFTVKTDNDMVIQVLNELGQQVRLVELNGQNQHQVQISGLSKGIYFIQSAPTATSNGILKQKLIVE